MFLLRNISCLSCWETQTAHGWESFLWIPETAGKWKFSFLNRHLLPFTKSILYSLTLGKLSYCITPFLQNHCRGESSWDFLGPLWPSPISSFSPTFLLLPMYILHPSSKRVRNLHHTPMPTRHMGVTEQAVPCTSSLGLLQPENSPLFKCQHPSEALLHSSNGNTVYLRYALHVSLLDHNHQWCDQENSVNEK